MSDKAPYSPCGTARGMGRGPPCVMHYYTGQSGAHYYLSWCGLKIAKNDPTAGWVKMDRDILAACGPSARGYLTEREIALCGACGERGAMVALGNTEL